MNASGELARDQRESVSAPSTGGGIVFNVALGGLILAVALLTRVPAIWPSLWGDELASVRNAQHDAPGELVKHMAQRETHPPLYFLLLHYWLSLGESDAWIRTLSLLTGLAVVAAVGVVGAAVGGRGTGWGATMLAAVCHPLCWISYHARGFALCVLLGTLAWLCLIRALKKGSAWYWALFSLLLVGSWYSFYYGFFIAVGLGMFFILSRPKSHDFLAFTAAMLLTVLLFTPWLPSFAMQRQRVAGWADRPAPPSWSATGLVTGAIRAATLHGPWNLFSTNTKAVLGVPVTRTLVIGLIGVVLLLALRIWPFSRGFEGDREARRWMWATIAFGVTFAAACQATALAGAYTWSLYSSFLGAVWCVATPLVLLFTTRALRIAVIVFLFVAGAWAEAERAFHRPTDDWRGAVAYIDRSYREDDAIISNEPQLALPFSFYTRLEPPPPIFHSGKARAAELADAATGRPRVWFLWLGEPKEATCTAVEETLCSRGYRKSVEEIFPRNLYVKRFDLDGETKE